MPQEAKAGEGDSAVSAALSPSPAFHTSPGIPYPVSAAISALRLPLMVGPVIVHACLAPHASLLQFILARIIGDAAVPTFFFLSGYLYLATFDGSFRCYARKLSSRVKSLVIPYFLWNLIGYFLLAYAVPMVAKSDFFKSFWGVRVARRGWWLAPVDGPLYFIKGLIFLSLGAPLLHRFLRIRFLAWLAPVAALFWAISPIEALSSRMTVVALSMFAFGGFMAMYRQNLMARLASSRHAGWISLAVFFAISIANAALFLAGEESRTLLRFGILAGIPLGLAIGGIISRSRLSGILANASGFAMFLFCSFDLIMAAGREHWRFFLKPSDGICLLVAILTVVASFALYIAISFILPPLARLLTGNRKPGIVCQPT